MRAARVDDNQKQIVADLRKSGVTVQHLHNVGKGCPDLLVGCRGKNYLFEIKDPAKSPSQRKKTEAQEKWHDEWRGQSDIAHTFEEVIEAIIKHENS